MQASSSSARSSPPAPAAVEPLAGASRSLPDMFLRRVSRSGSFAAWKQRLGAEWVETSFAEFQRRAAAVATYLLTLDLRLQDKVTIVGSTCGQWCVSDLGGQLAGLVTIGAYNTLTGEQLAYILEHSDSAVVFVEDREQLDKVLAARERAPRLRRIVVWDTAGVSEQQLSDARVVTLASVLETSPRHEAIADRVGAISAKDTAIIIYTSGTTGPPKGAMLSHENILVSLDALTETWRMGLDDWMFSFLPLAHAAERICGLYARINTGVPTVFAQGLSTVLDDVKEVRPTYFGSVPRIFEKAYARVQGEVERASRGKQRLFRWAEAVGIEHARLELAGRPVPAALRLQQRLADRLVFSNLRGVFGGRVKLFVTGAAPIPMQVLEFFWGAGFPIYEVYGMTEATCVTHANRPGDVRLGSVGRPVPHVEARLAEDGEVLIRGPVVFQGYYKDLEATAQAIDVSGFLHTGDVGRLDADGFLYIVDRKKHILITSGGKNLAPANIENTIKALDPIVAHVHAHADRRPYVSALVTINPLEALDWATRQSGLALTADTAQSLARAYGQNPLSPPDGLAAALREICSHPALRARVADAVRRGNARLSRVERVKRVLLLDRELSMAEDELTPTLKVKRKNIELKFAAAFDRLYSDAEAGLVIEERAD